VNTYVCVIVRRRRERWTLLTTARAARESSGTVHIAAPPEVTGAEVDIAIVAGRLEDSERIVEWELLAPRGPEPVTASGALSGDSHQFVLDAVVSGHGIGLVPEHLVARPLRRHRPWSASSRSSSRGGRFIPSCPLHATYGGA